MANWSEILLEVNQSNPGPAKDLDGIRRKYLGKLAEVTGRNAIAFYSGWLQKLGSKSPHFFISDSAMAQRRQALAEAEPRCWSSVSRLPGLMTAVNKLDKSKGLDLILHTPVIITLG